ncbi:MAG: glycosyltransferase [Anaerolineae bacterium]
MKRSRDHGQLEGRSGLDISVVIPLLDEEENIAFLHSSLHDVLEETGKGYEIIFVDDGSRDGSFAVLTTLHDEDPNHIRVIHFRRNFGKTAALTAGFGKARGEVIVTMDADLQDDPQEIPRLLDRLEEGYDMVVAWRRDRQDPLSKRLPSRIFNGTVSFLTRVHLHDLNCGFKAFRREVIANLKLYGELHRFIPVLAHWRGYRVTELAVVHHPRKYGRSKYGVERLGRAFVDFLVVLFLTRYLKRPLQLFGGIGAVLFLLGFGIGAYHIVLWLRLGGIGFRPLLFAGILAMIVGVQIASIGLLGEMIRRFTYHPEEEYSIDREMG